jgi:hypothetical protein
MGRVCPSVTLNWLVHFAFDICTDLLSTLLGPGQVCPQVLADDLPDVDGNRHHHSVVTSLETYPLQFQIPVADAVQRGKAIIGLRVGVEVDTPRLDLGVGCKFGLRENPFAGCRHFIARPLPTVIPKSRAYNGSPCRDRGAFTSRVHSSACCTGWLACQ